MGKTVAVLWRQKISIDFEFNLLLRNHALNYIIQMYYCLYIKFHCDTIILFKMAEYHKIEMDWLVIIIVCHKIIFPVHCHICSLPWVWLPRSNSTCPPRDDGYSPWTLTWMILHSLYCTVSCVV
jgi:hypothetical protein